MAENDDKHGSPLSPRRGEDRDWDGFQRRSQGVSHDELRTELTEFRVAMSKGFDRLSGEIERSEEKWRERTHELAQTAAVHTVDLALQKQRIEAIERAAKEQKEEREQLAKDQKEERRFLWGAVISAAGLIGGLVAWLTELVKHAK